MQFDEQLKEEVASPELVAEHSAAEQSAAELSAAVQTTIVHNQLAAGTVIGGTYRIVSSLGSGGMSDVYRCEDIALKRFVAVKLLHADSASKEQSLLRFQQEGKAIAMLKHPNIVEILALQSTENDEPYLVMEMVQGIPLSRLIANEGALSISRTTKIVNQICDALAHAHSQGVIHRDLKPGNIMIVNPGGPDESVKLLDFGIAKIVSPSAIKATQTGDVFGSPGYMSPEQVQGKSISEKSDQYSLGCVIFEMLTGKMPFQSEHLFAVMMAHVKDEAPTLAKAANREFPLHIERTVAKMMAKEPDQRFVTISDAAKGFAGQATVEKPKKPVSYDWLILLLTLAVICFSFFHSNIWSTMTQKPPGPQNFGRVSHYMSNWAEVADYHPTNKEKDNFPLYIANHQHEQQLVVFLEYPHITDEQLAQAFRTVNPNLRRLSLQDCQITGSCLSSLQNLPNLQYLNLGSTQHLLNWHIGAYLNDLSKVPSLKVLRLFYDGLTDQSMAEVSRIKSLEDIDLNGNRELSGAGLMKLLNMPNLQRIDVENTKVTREDCLQFKRQYTQLHKPNGKDLQITFGIPNSLDTVREDNQRR